MKITTANVIARYRLAVRRERLLARLARIEFEIRALRRKLCS